MSDVTSVVANMRAHAERKRLLEWWADQPANVVTCWVWRDGEWTLRVRPLSRAEIARAGT